MSIYRRLAAGSEQKTECQKSFPERCTRFFSQIDDGKEFALGSALQRGPWYSHSSKSPARSASSPFLFSNGSSSNMAAATFSFVAVSQDNVSASRDFAQDLALRFQF